MAEISHFELENIIENAIRDHKIKVMIPSGTPTDEVRKIIRIFMRRHPEVFWFSHQYEFDITSGTLYFKYNFSRRKKDFYVKEIDKAVNSLFQPKKLLHLSDLQKVSYVYKWIAQNTTYNEYSSFNQTIYSVLINRNSVCTGYAKTAQYLLGLLGVKSELVFGKFNLDASVDGRHGWNLVKIENNWYHVDFCLADPKLGHLLNQDEDPIIIDGLLWNYFCKSTEYILKNRSIEFLSAYPECTGSIDLISKVTLLCPEVQAIVCKSDSGSSAKIFLDSFDSQSVIKIARSNQSLIENEALILNILKDCRHIIKCKGHNHLGIKLEQLIPWSELIGSHYYIPGEERLKKIFIQLTEGLIECRNKGITYSDIHYNNIFVGKDGIYKWGDFGIAFYSKPDGQLPSFMLGEDGKPLGSRWFMAPETYYYHVFTESSAIYSLAMIAYFVMNDMRPPFWKNNQKNNNVDEESIIRRLNGEFIPLPCHACDYPYIARQICQILNANRFERLQSFEDFIAILLDNECHRRDCFIENRENIDGPSKEGICDYDGITSTSFKENITIGSDVYARTGYGGVNVDDNDIFAATVCNTVAPNSEVDSHVGYNCFPPLAPAVLQPKISTSPLMDNLIETYGPAQSESLRQEEINGCLYAPAAVRPQKTFIIRVYLYRIDEKDIVDSKVKEIDSTAVKKEYKPLDLPVKYGDKLTVQLNLSDGVNCKETVKSIVWRNHFADCAFFAKLIDAEQESIEGTVYTYVNDLPAGEMLFTIDVVDSISKELYAKVEARNYSKIFISYAHQDENQVRGIAEGCKMLGKDYFFDRHTLLAGDIFKEKILNYIDNADLFVLCWSKNAAKSKWVQIEREYALRLIQERKAKLSIYPLRLKPEAPLPIDMSEKYNFGVL